MGLSIGLRAVALLMLMLGPCRSIQPGSFLPEGNSNDRHAAEVGRDCDERICFRDQVSPKVNGLCNLEGLTASSSSGNGIEVMRRLPIHRELVFTDRADYKFTSLGSFAGMAVYYIRAANDDKDTPASEVMWSIETNVSVRVYVDFWGGDAHVDGVTWLDSDGWTYDSSINGTVYMYQGRETRGPGRVYKKEFSAGTINLKGNDGDGHGSYYVFVESTCEDPQRSALRDLYHATAGNGWKRQAYWLQEGNYCNLWAGVKCNAHGDVTRLLLHDNDLTGTIPASIGDLSKLERLHLHTNSLSGTVPGTIGSLTNLEEYFIHRNVISGSIPSTVGQMTKLREFWMSQNELVHPVPSEFGVLDRLVGLRLGDNYLNGSIPETLGNLKHSLQYLYMENNWLNGTIPESLGQLTALRKIHLNNNSLSGNGLPVGLCSTDFRSCSIQHNFFTCPLTCSQCMERADFVCCKEPYTTSRGFWTCTPPTQSGLLEGQLDPGATYKTTDTLPETNYMPHYNGVIDPSTATGVPELFYVRQPGACNVPLCGGGFIVKGMCNFPLNTYYQLQGYTADGRPWYVAANGLLLYWDASCFGGVWVIDDTPINITASSDLNSDGSCENLAFVASTADRPPSASWTVWCHHQGYTAMEVTLIEGARQVEQGYEGKPIVYGHSAPALADEVAEHLTNVEAQVERIGDAATSGGEGTSSQKITNKHQIESTGDEYLAEVPKATIEQELLTLGGEASTQQQHPKGAHDIFELGEQPPNSNDPTRDETLDDKDDELNEPDVASEDKSEVGKAGSGGGESRGPEASPSTLAVDGNGRMTEPAQYVEVDAGVTARGDPAKPSSNDEASSTRAIGLRGAMERMNDVEDEMEVMTYEYVTEEW